MAKQLMISVTPSTTRTVWHVLIGEEFVSASFEREGENGEPAEQRAIVYARALFRTLAAYVDVDITINESAGSMLRKVDK